MANVAGQTSGAIAALEEADALVAAGRPMDAIELLVGANRSRRDRRIEERLVVLRHLAFSMIEHRGPAADPPAIRAQPQAPGPVSELRPQDLGVDALRRGFSRHGCVLVRGLVSPERAAKLAHGIDHVLDAFDAAQQGTPVGETSPWFSPFSPVGTDYRIGGRRTWMRASGGVWTVDSPRMLFDLLDLIEETGIGDLISEYLGERPALSANKCNLRRVPIDTSTNWHQDGAFLGAEVRTVNLWLGLSACGRDAPGLDVIPRRIDEILETGTEGAIFDWSVGPGVVEALGTPVFRPEIEPGDALLFDHLFLHRTGIDPTMSVERYAMETWFFAPSVYPKGQIPIVY